MCALSRPGANGLRQWCSVSHTHAGRPEVCPPAPILPLLGYCCLTACLARLHHLSVPPPLHGASPLTLLLFFHHRHPPIRNLALQPSRPSPHPHPHPAFSALPPRSAPLPPSPPPNHHRANPPRTRARETRGRATPATCLPAAASCLAWPGRYPLALASAMATSWSHTCVSSASMPPAWSWSSSLASLGFGGSRYEVQGIGCRV